MTTTSVFTNSGSQVIRLPAELRWPDGVKRVSIRARGVERILVPIGQTWDSFFLNNAEVAPDFMQERPNQPQPNREAL